MVCWGRDTRGFMFSEYFSCFRKCCCCSSLKRFTFEHWWRSVSGPSYCVGTTDVGFDHFWPACNYQLTSSTTEVNIYAANTIPTKWQLFQDIVSKRTFPTSYFKTPSSRWTTDLHPKWEVSHPGCRGRWVKRSSLLNMKSHEHQVLYTELKQLDSA